MPRFMALCACTLALATGLSLQAPAVASVPLVIQHQGRLLDANDQPVSGNIAIRFRVLDASSDGVELWTEFHPSVVVTEGLFTVDLGSITPLTADMLAPPSSGPVGVVERYLEIKIGNDPPLVPRVRLGSAPYSVAAGRMAGDIETVPGEVRLSGMSGSTTATIRSSSNPGDPGSEMELVDGGGSTTGTIRASSTTGGEVSLIHHSGSTTGTIRMAATSGSVGNYLDDDDDGDGISERSLFLVVSSFDASEGLLVDSDDDGVPDNSVTSRITPTTASHAINTKGTGAQAGRVFSASSQSDGSSARTFVWRQDEGAPVPLPEQQVSLLVDADSAGVVVGNDGGGDAHVTVSARSDPDFLDESIDLRTSPTGGAVATLIGHGGSTTGTIKMMAKPESTVITCDADSDDDGFSESRVAWNTVADLGPVDHGAVSLKLQADANDDGIADDEVDIDCGGATGDARLVVKGDLSVGQGTLDLNVTSSGAGQIAIADFDSDGIAERKATLNVTPLTTIAGWYADTDDDGVADYSVENTADASKSSLVVKGNLSVGQGTLDLNVKSSGVRQLAAADLDGDGFSERSIASLADGSVAVVGSYSDIDDDGVADYSVVTTCDATKSSLMVSGDLSVGSGSIEFRVNNNMDPICELLDPTGRRFLVEPDSGVQLYDNLGAKTCDLGTDGTITVSGSLTIGGATASHFIDVVGGAYCDGTDWVNASDVALKENFHPVDGDDLLARIADLQIRRWNYKGQPDVEHIGPTAQDFQAAFGVGADDKSISTIDPSGVALAAIKQLQKQNRELADQNQELREELERLCRKVDALVSTR